MLKQYVIVPDYPEMSTGKIASQVAHATYLALDKQNRSEGSKDYPYSETIDKWRETGMCVIILRCRTQTQLMNVAKYCEQWRIQGHLYIDEGATEVEMGTATSFATSVLEEEQQWPFQFLDLY